MKKTAPKTTPIEMAFETAAFKTTAFRIPLPSDALLLRLQSGTYALAVNENDENNDNNDDLYQELERRYGGGYAQALVEGLKRSQKN